MVRFAPTFRLARCFGSPPPGGAGPRGSEGFDPRAFGDSDSVPFPEPDFSGPFPEPDFSVPFPCGASRRPALRTPFLVREAAPVYGEGGGPAVPGSDDSVLPGSDDSALSGSDDSALPGSDDSALPDPFADADALEELGEEIATLAAHIHAATHRLLVLLAEFDRREGWKLGGHRSAAHWLHARTGVDLGAAREKVRTARVLVGLPETGACMARGELSFSKVRALTRVATPENESELLDFARQVTTAQVERMVRGYRTCSGGEEEIDLERERHRARTLSVFADLDGMYVVKGRLPPELGVLLMRAVEAASDALYRERKLEPPWDRVLGRGEESEREAARRRADALALMAERALEAGFGGGAEEGQEAEDGEARGGSVPVSGSRAERYQVMVHVEAETLRAEGEAGRSELEDGTRVSAETSRRLSCDCGVVEVTHDAEGSVLDVGRRRRTIPPALRRALEARDRGCRFPGCGLRFTEAHHVVHWADGGETKLGNTLLLCRYHHRLLHEEGWSMDWWGEGRPVFFSPRGDTYFDGRWKPPGIGPTPVEDLVEENEARGVRPHGWTASARWEREADIPTDELLQAAEIMDEELLGG